jgi:hypothetical protein
MKLRYVGTAPGQAEEIRISGAKYQRGNVYDVDEATAKVLLRKGGFIPVYETNYFDDDEELAVVMDTAEGME